MAVTASPYVTPLAYLGTGQINLGSDTLKLLLTTASYTPDVDNHVTLSNITGEVTGTGYTAGGATLTGVNYTVDTTNNLVQFTANAVTFTNATLTARYAVIYKSTGTASTSLLLGYIDFGENKTYSAEDFQITFPSGFFRLKLPA